MEISYLLGLLTQQPLKIDVTTACVHCGQLLELEIGSQQRFQVKSAGAVPLVFEPRVNFNPKVFKENNILNAY